MVIKNKERIDDLDSIEQDLINSGKMLPSSDSKSNHYVNNKECYEAFLKYHKIKLLHDERDLPAPPLPDIIAKAILQIANRRVRTWKVVRGASESWKQEFVGNAVLTATMRGVNFDPEKSNNIFAYLTSIINNAILEQLKKERTELYVRYKQMNENEDFYGSLDEEIRDELDISQDFSNEATLNRMNFIETYEMGVEKRREKKRKATMKKKDTPNTLDL